MREVIYFKRPVYAEALAAGADCIRWRFGACASRVVGRSHVRHCKPDGGAVSRIRRLIESLSPAPGRMICSMARSSYTPNPPTSSCAPYAPARRVLIGDCCRHFSRRSRFMSSMSWGALMRATTASPSRKKERAEHEVRIDRLEKANRELRTRLARAGHHPSRARA